MKLKLIAFSTLIYLAGGIGWLWLGHPPLWFQIYFYPLAWWPLLILVETLAELKWEKSLLYSSPQDFLILSLFSVPFWTGYEILNTHLKNWAYTGPSTGMDLRWAGYVVAYASVLPAIRVYLDLLNPSPDYAACLEADNKAKEPLLMGKKAVGAGILLGTFQLILCVFRPLIFYPLAWSFTFFFTEPFVARKRRSYSYLVMWSRSKWKITVKTLLAGLMAGCTWEFLNWKAQAKWIYTLPEEVTIFKIFEMPFLGYVGFSAFALCAESFSNLILSFKTHSKSSMFWVTSVVLSAIVSLVGFALIDAYTWIM